MSPYSRNTGKRYAAGSQKKWGGWETRVCAECGHRIVLSRDHASHHFNGGSPFSLCGAHGYCYGKFFGAAEAA